MSSKHVKRTGDLIRRIVSETLLTKVRDPRIGIITITGVEISREFDTARIFVSCLGDEAARDQTLEGLRSAAPFLQAEIAKSIRRLRRVPRLRFIYDDSIERSFRIEQALRDIDLGEEKTDEAADIQPEEGSGT